MGHEVGKGRTERPVMYIGSSTSDNCPGWVPTQQEPMPPHSERCPCRRQNLCGHVTVMGGVRNPQHWADCHREGRCYYCGETTDRQFAYRYMDRDGGMCMVPLCEGCALAKGCTTPEILKRFRGMAADATSAQCAQWWVDQLPEALRARRVDLDERDREASRRMMLSGVRR